ncbi:hypothetical protein [Teichococcus aestuarii]|uniref:hypothetical protein n=1 Tax=Teichococcus aestuarii TaxID=568898 RepID=UPI0036159F74
MSLTVPAGAVASSGATSRLSQIASQYSAAKLLALRPDPAPAPSPAKPQPQPAAASPGSGTASPAAVLQNLPVPQKAPQNAGANGAPAPIRLDSPRPPTSRRSWPPATPASRRSPSSASSRRRRAARGSRCGAPGPPPS